MSGGGVSEGGATYWLMEQSVSFKILETVNEKRKDLIIHSFIPSSVPTGQLDSYLVTTELVSFHHFDSLNSLPFTKLSLSTRLLPPLDQTCRIPLFIQDVITCKPSTTIFFFNVTARKTNPHLLLFFLTIIVFPCFFPTGFL